MPIKVEIPLPNNVIHNLRVGDAVLLSGVMCTGRDAVHKWISDTFIKKTRTLVGDDLDTYQAIKSILKSGVIYHCGPVVGGLDTKQYRFVAAGPTTSIREEPYQGDVMRHFDLKGVIGKGGMGPKTLLACEEVPAVYFHAIGGAASLIAESVKKVRGVYKLDFGVPEAIWVIEVQDFAVVVTMVAHGNSLHENVRQQSRQVYERLITS